MSGFGKLLEDILRETLAAGLGVEARDRIKEKLSTNSTSSLSRSEFLILIEGLDKETKNKFFEYYKQCHKQNPQEAEQFVDILADYLGFLRAGGTSEEKIKEIFRELIKLSAEEIETRLQILKGRKFKDAVKGADEKISQILEPINKQLARRLNEHRAKMGRKQNDYGYGDEVLVRDK